MRYAIKVIDLALAMIKAGETDRLADALEQLREGLKRTDEFLATDLIPRYFPKEDCDA